ncbi:uncharacterized protein DSM5745_05538 [Aspergillus mulundensis]|uniref:Uncharacterized protein n=1 Tax=Aspergillus mulundensis TaxID=1810919 RepID=A0A3D8RXG6_9EURO|nr:hypothetical protein DSM5745_05538 [Aspergillus mulundensis]RDW78686.1 hypothetical protein DSM5745_05538 [Aspergillus mulundensis]
MPPTTSLSTLSPELDLAILGQLSSAKDLYAAIAVSPTFYHLFSNYKRSVISSVLRNAIPREIEKEFVLAYHAQSLWAYVYEPPDTVIRQQIFDPDSPVSQEIVEEFEVETRAVLKMGQDGEWPTLSSLSADPEVLMDMWDFYRKFEGFMLEYSEKALAELRRLPTGLDNDTNMDLDPEADTTRLPISITEESRLKRAFFRFELYTCLFQFSQVTYGDLYIQFGPVNPLPAEEYLSSLCGWEAEELACVAQFYSTLVEGLCHKIDADFVARVKAKAKADGAALTAPGLKVNRDSVNYWLNYHNFRWFSGSYKKRYRRIHIDYIVSRGVLALSKVTRAPFHIAQEMILQCHLLAEGQTSIVTDLHRLYPSDSVSHNPAPAQSTDLEQITAAAAALALNPAGTATATLKIGFPGYGFKMAVARTPGRRWECNAPGNRALRSVGFLFWDEARLRAVQLLTVPAGKSPRGHRKNVQDVSVENALAGLNVRREVVVAVLGDVLGPEWEGKSSTGNGQAGDAMDIDGGSGHGMDPRFDMHWRD